MLKIISERHEESRTGYRLQFTVKGERAKNRYSFPLLSKNAVIIPIKETEFGSNQYIPCTEEECTWWKDYLLVKDDREHYEEPCVVEETWYWTEPAHAICECGTEIILEDEFLGTCQCPVCGRWYNMFGQEVLDPEEYEEDLDDAEWFNEY